MDRNDEYEIIKMLDRVIFEHASHIQRVFNTNREVDDRMHISSARVRAMEELETLLVDQLRNAHKKSADG